MITNVKSVYDLTFEPQISITTTPPINPIDGDIYYDPAINKNFMYGAGKWYELTIHRKQSINEGRKEKIKKIYL